MMDKTAFIFNLAPGSNSLLQYQKAMQSRWSDVCLLKLKYNRIYFLTFI